MIRCKYCNSDKVVKAGKHKSEKYGVRQMYLCKKCKRRFVEESKAPRYSDSFKEKVVRSVVFEGLGIRQAGRVFKLSTTTILRWIKDFKKTKQCEQEN
ncbi:IS1/IS1595 family N-terminal zinc-binding domain-containing protein [Methanocaldococcus infernus]